uniref:Uncharacterized protein n=1 Tax=Sphaerodactylus townsendi TaxID=933632 RepID=A0ACB8FWP4_9SAUR
MSSRLGRRKEAETGIADVPGVPATEGRRASRWALLGNQVKVGPSFACSPVRYDNLIPLIMKSIVSIQ